MNPDTLRNVGLLVMRSGLGGMMITHGWPKVMAGPDTWIKLGNAMTHFGIDFQPALWGLAAALSETVGGLLLVIGFYTRPAAAALLFTMIVAARLHLVKDGLSDASHAIEDGFAFFGIMLLGGGAWSADARFRGKS